MINRGGLRLPASDFELALAGVEGLLPGPRRRVRRHDARTGRRASGSWCSPSRAGPTGPARPCSRARARLADAGLPVDVVELVRPGFIPRTTSGKLRRGARARRRRGIASDAASSRDAEARSSHARWRRFASWMNGETRDRLEHDRVHDVHREPQRPHDVEEQDHPLLVGVVPHLVLVGVVEDQALALAPRSRSSSPTRIRQRSRGSRDLERRGGTGSRPCTGRCGPGCACRARGSRTSPSSSRAPRPTSRAVSGQRAQFASERKPNP